MTNIIQTKHGTVYMYDETSSYHFTDNWSGDITEFVSREEAEAFAEQDKGERAVNP